LPPLGIPPLRSPAYPQSTTSERAPVIQTTTAQRAQSLPQIDEQTMDDIIKDLGYRQRIDTSFAEILSSPSKKIHDQNLETLKGRKAVIDIALQDIFIPQHTIYDDYDEINKFKRNKNENIRTTVRRASLLIYKL